MWLNCPPINNMFNNLISVLVNDYYKLCHPIQYSRDITQMTSYLTPRKSRLPGIDKMVFFGLAAYVQRYVKDMFDKQFFSVPRAELRKQLIEAYEEGLGYNRDTSLLLDCVAEFEELHSLGYLPVEIKAVPEGTLVPMGCPCVEISTTHPKFAWAGQLLEAQLSASIWHPCVSATIAREYRKIAEAAYDKTVPTGLYGPDARSLMCDFSMRGQESNESAVASSAAWLTAMHNSSTVAARHYIKTFYEETSKAPLPIHGLTSTEHSVMTTWACKKGGSEIDAYRHLFEIYKNISFCIVCDSYDFYSVILDILPYFKSEIQRRGKNGTFVGVRHDSAEPVAALCGTVPLIPLRKYTYMTSEKALSSPANYQVTLAIPHKKLKTLCHSAEAENDRAYEIALKLGPDAGEVVGIFYPESILDTELQGTFVSKDRSRTAEEKGMVETLYEAFGGSVNEKGYKELNPGIKAVYGDSITLSRAKLIFEVLAEKGFAATCVSLGVGSFSMQCMEGENGKLYPFTRDTFSIAIKCTHMTYKMQLPDSSIVTAEAAVYKSPKGCSEKTSHRGKCLVWFDDSYKLQWQSGCSVFDEMASNKNALKPVFRNGTVIKSSFLDIRRRINSSLID